MVTSSLGNSCTSQLRALEQSLMQEAMQLERKIEEAEEKNLPVEGLYRDLLLNSKESTAILTGMYS